RYQYYFHGKREKVTFGRYPDLGLADARKRQDEAVALLSSHAKLTVKSVPNELKMEFTSLRSSSPFKLQNLRQKYLACFQRSSILLSSGLYGGR
ncbi:MAG: Arm DNA-binding domain, partial [Marmoricola sp.]|nr:Arm DNA-binding domain [Marmoricola sp.]